jgi:hypothetical protein
MTATATSIAPSPIESLGHMMRSLKLPAFARYAEEIAQKPERERGPSVATSIISPSSR